MIDASLNLYDVVDVRADTSANWRSENPWIEVRFTDEAGRTTEVTAYLGGKVSPAGADKLKAACAAFNAALGEAGALLVEEGGK